MTDTRDLLHEQLPFHDITLQEVQDAIFVANPRKAAGVDGLPALVWQQLWPVLQEAIYAIFKHRSA